MNEATTHIVGTICLVFLFVIVPFVEAGFTWLMSVFLILILMVIRSILGDISKRTEGVFQILLIVTLFAFLINLL